MNTNTTSASAPASQRPLNQAFSNAATLAAFTPLDVTDTDSWENHCSQAALHSALAQQIQAANSEILTEADEIAAIFDSCLSQVKAGV